MIYFIPSKQVPQTVLIPRELFSLVPLNPVISSGQIVTFKVYWTTTTTGVHQGDTGTTLRNQESLMLKGALYGQVCCTFFILKGVGEGGGGGACDSNWVSIFQVRIKSKHNN